MGALANAGGDTRTETPALAFAITRAAHLSYDHSMNRDQQGHGVGIPVRPGYAGPEPDASGNIHKGFSNRNRKAQNPQTLLLLLQWYLDLALELGKLLNIQLHPLKNKLVDPQ